jgi:hypothetical protein
MSCCFAVVPDELEPGEASHPLAAFENIEDAMNWGLRKYAGRAFRIRSHGAVKNDESATSRRPTDTRARKTQS